MRTIVDLRCSQGHYFKDVWCIVPIEGNFPCSECGAQLMRADAPRVSPQGIPADREVDVPRVGRVDTAAIAAETAKEIEAKWDRFSDPKVAEEVVGREVDAHLNDPLPETPDLSFDVSRVTDLRTGESHIETANLDTVAGL